MSKSVEVLVKDIPNVLDAVQKRTVLRDIARTINYYSPDKTVAALTDQGLECEGWKSLPEWVRRFELRDEDGQIEIHMHTEPVARLEEKDSMLSVLGTKLSPPFRYPTRREEGARLLGSVAYSTDLFAGARIQRLAGHYGVLLESIVTKPEAHLSSLRFLTDPECHQLLVEWNATEAGYTRDKCLHQLFEVQVERTPGVVAVVYGEQALTYREFNARASQVAHYLRAQEVGPKVLVGICMERSMEMVVGILGILKGRRSVCAYRPELPEGGRRPRAGGCAARDGLDAGGATCAS